MAQKWLGRLQNPWRLASPHCFKAGQNHRWLTSGPSAYINPAAGGVPTASHREQNHRGPTSGLGGYVTPAASGVPIA